MLRIEWLIGLALAGMVGLGLLLVTQPHSAQAREHATRSILSGIVAAPVYTSPTDTVPPGPGPNEPVPGSIHASSAYTSGGDLFDGALAFDNDVNTSWISDPAQPPEGQWIEWDILPDVQLDEIWLNADSTTIRYSRPQTSTLTGENGVAQVLTWTDTHDIQPVKLAVPVKGRVRLTIDTVWGDQNKQPVGIADLTLFMSRVRPVANTLPSPSSTLPTPISIAGPTSTAPGTVPVTSTAAEARSGGSGADPWRWWLVGVMVLLAGFFLVRGLRRQRGP